MLACFYLMMKFLPFLLLILLFFFSCLFSLSNREKRKSSQTFRIKIILFMCEVRGMRNNSKEDFSREEKSFFSHFFPSSLIATKTFTPGEWIKFYHRASLRIKEKSRVGTATKMFFFLCASRITLKNAFSLNYYITHCIHSLPMISFLFSGSH